MNFPKIRTRSEIVTDADEHRRLGNRIALTNGCFDLLHVGHVRLLAEAKALAGILIVGLNSDSSVRALKGPSRPLVPENERAELLASFGCVDYVVVFSELTPEALVADIRPHVHVKGADYAPGFGKDMPEADLVRRLGGEIHYVELQTPRSTTSLIERIRHS
jgi:D-beta-D-heptose 7-phosphate kinase/D-beta-D-heptose 1-phosphate adenosyltransferase